VRRADDLRGGLSILFDFHQETTALWSRVNSAILSPLTLQRWLYTDEAQYSLVGHGSSFVTIFKVKLCGSQNFKVSGQETQSVKIRHVRGVCCWVPSAGSNMVIAFRGFVFLAMFVYPS
jgi:hypothetical protein